MNLENYFPVLLFLLVGLGVGVAPQVLGHLLGPNKPDAAKLSPYECGFEAFEDARMLNSIADNIQGRTICALGDAAAMPVRAFVKQFREEFEYHVEHKHCLVPTYL